MQKKETVPPLKICRECKVAPSRVVRLVKAAILENPANMPAMNRVTRGVVEDYVYKNKIKSPQDRARIARMAIPTSSFWRAQRVLTVSFMGGDAFVRDRIMEHAKIWMDYMGIELKFLKNPKKATDIRIGFDYSDGSWSYVGTDAMQVDSRKPTMNYGWLYSHTDDKEYHRTVLHEFGHALGCIHEHQHPAGGIPWNKKKAYEFYGQQGWSPEEVRTQVFNKYKGDLVRGSTVDKKSIMMYPIPNEITIGDFEVKWNNALSPKDKIYIGEVYPKI